MTFAGTVGSWVVVSMEGGIEPFGGWTIAETIEGLCLAIDAVGIAVRPVNRVSHGLEDAHFVVPWSRVRKVCAVDADSWTAALDKLAQLGGR